MSETHFRLDALAPENLLGFLALMGVLRALGVARPNWSVTTSWRGDDPRPDVGVAAAITEEEFFLAVAEGVRAHHTAMQFTDRKSIDYAPKEFRDLVLSEMEKDELASGLRLSALGALTCDSPFNERMVRVFPTPYCLMFGQGHQDFLPRFSQAASLQPSDPVVELRAALFEPWKYDHAGLTFRWDPTEDRRYALRAENPSSSKTMTSDLANRIAAVGLLAFGVIPNSRFISAPGVRRGRRSVSFAWPIWRVPMTERGIVALLRHPYVIGPRKGSRRPAGVERVQVAQRQRTGKYFVVTPGLAE